MEPPVATFRQRLEKFLLDRFVRHGASGGGGGDPNLRRRLLVDAIAEGYKRFGELTQLHQKSDIK